MADSVLLARMVARDSSGNKYTLDIRRGDNRELVLRLATADGTPCSLSNMQPSVRPPAFCSDDFSTVNDIERWVGRTLYRLVEVERGPSALKRRGYPVSFEFTPKAGGEPWTADVEAELHRHNGYDVILFLDKKAKTEDSGWMLELAVEADGSITGQITAHPGYDALAVFTCTQDTLKVYDDSSTVPACIVTRVEED